MNRILTPLEIQQMNELEALKKVLSFLCDGNMKAFAALFFIKENYKEWGAMLKWLKANNLRGNSLVQFFENESADGGGYHSGAVYILSRIKGHKHGLVNIKGDELI